MGVEHSPAEDGFTILQLAAVALLIIAVGGFLLLGVLPASLRGGPSEGTIGTYTGESGYAMHTVGPITGISATDGNYSGVSLRFSEEKPDNLGAVGMTVALFLGDMGPVSMDNTSMYWVSGPIIEQLPQKTGPVLICPGWTITGRQDSANPAQPATIGMSLGKPPFSGTSRRPGSVPGAAGDVLSRGSQFNIMLCPANSTPPYQQFSVWANPPKTLEPPVAILTAPPMDHPVMILGTE